MFYCTFYFTCDRFFNSHAFASIHSVSWPRHWDVLPVAQLTLHGRTYYESLLRRLQLQHTVRTGRRQHAALARLRCVTIYESGMHCATSASRQLACNMHELRFNTPPQKSARH